MGMGEGLVLALDGSTRVCSAALLGLRGPGATPSDVRRVSPAQGDDGDSNDVFEVLARRSDGDGRAQAKLLLRLVHEMLEESGRRPADLSAVVVGRGPGTFTGVRVTVATARALSLALAIPVMGVSTIGGLAAMAAEAATLSTITRAGLEAIVSVVDAHRGQLFYGLYRPTPSEARSDLGAWRRQGDLRVCDRGALGATVAHTKTVVVGEEALRPEELPANALFLSRDFAAQYLVIGQERLDEPGRLPEGRRLTEWLRRALALGKTAWFEEPGEGALGDPGTPESVVPIYVRSPDADVHITRMRDPWAGGSTDK